MQSSKAWLQPRLLSFNTQTGRWKVHQPAVGEIYLRICISFPLNSLLHYTAEGSSVDILHMTAVREVTCAYASAFR